MAAEQVMSTIQQNLQSEVLGIILAVIIMLFFICAAVFLIFRKTRLWYWRVNEQVTILQNIDIKLDRINAGLIKRKEEQETEEKIETPEIIETEDKSEATLTEPYTEIKACEEADINRTIDINEKPEKAKPGYNISKTGKIYDENILRNQIQF
ncbi:MAG: hypothetical protein ACI4LO_06245 [Anaerovoracaceae bacterium]